MTIRAYRLRTRLPLIVMAGLVFLQIFSPTPATKFVLWGIAGVLAVCFVWVRVMTRGLVVKRERRHGWAQVGDILEERFVMHNHSWVPVPWAEVRDYSNLPGYSASRAVGLGARRFTRWEKRCLCTQRGVFTLGPIEIHMGDPFGLFEAAVRHNYSESFVVYPAIARLPELITPRGVSRGSGRANVRAMDSTTNASSVRSYVPGDALNRIHWRSTARRTMPDSEELYVREDDIEPSGDVWMILDLQASAQAGEGRLSTEEYAVILAASLAEQLLSAQHAVGLVAYGHEPAVLWPQKGRHQLWEVLRVLAGTHASGWRPFSEVLRLTVPVLGRGVSAALITPSTADGWVQVVPEFLMRGVHTSALLLDAASFGGNGDPQAILRSLADLGVRSRIIDRSLRLEEAGLSPTEQRPGSRPGTRSEPPEADSRRAVRERRRTSSRWVPVGQG
jgi:uncharacterized protein (DUF58 family)